MEEKKVMETEQAVANNNEEQNGAPADDKKDEKKDGILKKIGNGIKQNKGKILGVVTIAGAFGAGMVADHFGVKLPFGKKKTDQTEDVPAEE